MQWTWAVCSTKSASTEHSSVDGSGTRCHVGCGGCDWLTGWATEDSAVSFDGHELATQHTTGACTEHWWYVCVVWSCNSFYFKSLSICHLHYCWAAALNKLLSAVSMLSLELTCHFSYVADILAICRCPPVCRLSVTFVRPAWAWNFR